MAFRKLQEINESDLTSHGLNPTINTLDKQQRQPPEWFIWQYHFLQRLLLLKIVFLIHGLNYLQCYRQASFRTGKDSATVSRLVGGLSRHAGDISSHDALIASMGGASEVRKSTTGEDCTGQGKVRSGAPILSWLVKAVMAPGRRSSSPFCDGRAIVSCLVRIRSLRFHRGGTIGKRT